MPAIEPEPNLSQFALTVCSVGVNKTTGERYWKATTSDIFPDSYNDEMSLELYASFLERIRAEIKPPAEFRSELWDGGMPYVSVSHYREHSVAGNTDKLYIDGAMLKAQGVFLDTPLGRACFDALWRELYNQKGAASDPVRVSIAFVDYKHRHKGSGFVFVRESLTDVCPECAREKLNGEYSGRVFLDGHLIHLAMTRVPVNSRTLMEVRSMTTRKEDAASIVGESLAEELESREALVGKSEAVVIKSEEPEVAERSMDEDEAEYRPFGGATTLSDARAYIQAGKEQRRVGDIWYTFQHVLSNIMHDSEMEMEEKAKKIKACSDEFKAMVSDRNVQIFESLAQLSVEGDAPVATPAPVAEPAPVIVPDALKAVGDRLEALQQSLTDLFARLETFPQKSAAHPLDAAMAQMRADFDQVAEMEASGSERLQAIQPTFVQLGEVLRGLLSAEPAKEEPVVQSTDSALLKVIQNLSDKIDLLASQQRSVAAVPNAIPAPRSISPASVQQITHEPKRTPSGPTPVLRAMIDKSVGLE